MSHVIGVDIGTYQSKGVLVNRSGEIISKSVREHDLDIPQNGYAEHDAENVWWEDFKSITSELVSDGKKLGIESQEIEAVCISTIAPAVVPINSKGKALRNAILYGIDTRADQEIKELNSKFGKENIFEVSGHHLSSQSAGPKILWIKNNEPEIYNNTFKFLSGNGYLAYKLTGETYIDYYTAAVFSPMFNINEKKWNDKTAKYIAAKDMLPQLAWSDKIIGKVNEKAARECSLSPETKVVLGSADAMAESISVGAVNDNDLMIMYGSSTFFIQITNKIKKTPNFWPSLHAVSGKKTLTGGTSTAGSITRWFINNWLKDSEKEYNIDEIFSYLTEKAESSPPGANGLITLPYFSGERTPINDSQARGIMFGLTISHKLGDVYRSILEGIAYSINHNIKKMEKCGIESKKIIAVGGGTKNSVWLEAVSDISGLTQKVPEETIGAAYGDAFLAALAIGWYDKIEDVNLWVNYEKEITPNINNKNLYNKYFDMYLELYKDNKEKMHRLNKLKS